MRIFLIYWLITILISFILVVIDRVKYPKNFKSEDNIDMTFLAIIISLIPFVNFIMVVIAFDELKEGKTQKEKDRLKTEQEKYTNISSHLTIFSESNFRCYKLEDIKDSIESLIHNYKTILQNEFHKELAYSRLEYLLTFLEECKKNEMIKDDKILAEVRSMVKSLNELFQQLVDDINDINTKANNELKEHIKSITKKYVADTNQMINDFKEYNKNA